MTLTLNSWIGRRSLYQKHVQPFREINREKILEMSCNFALTHFIAEVVTLSKAKIRIFRLKILHTIIFSILSLLYPYPVILNSIFLRNFRLLKELNHTCETEPELELG